MILSLSSLSSCFCLHFLCVLLYFLSQSSFILCFVWHVFVWLFFNFVYFVFHIKIKKKKVKIQKNRKTVCFVYISTCVPWMTIETKFSKLCISCSLDEHLYAQLSKWALWFLFVMSKIKLSLVLNTHITLFDRND